MKTGQTLNRGQWVILVMIAVAVAMAGFAWWVRFTRSQPVLQHWGTEAPAVIRMGQQVELWQLTAAADDWQGPSVQIPAHDRSRGRESNENADVGEASGNAQASQATHQTLAIIGVHDITNAPGLIHARHHLVHPKGFRWDVPPTDDPAHWELAMNFQLRPEPPTETLKSATVLFDFKHQRVYLVQREQNIDMAPIADAMRTFLTELLPADQSKPTE